MTTTSSTALQSFIYSSNPPRLQVLDQLLLPHQKVYVEVPDIVTAWQTIHTMQIRGAPLIAIVAVLGLAVDLHKNSSELDQIEAMIASTHGGDDPEQRKEACADAVYAYIIGKMDYIATSRPTAVNLFNALAELKDKVWEAKTTSATTSSSARQRMVQAIVDHGQFMLERDIADCQAIGKHGAHEILKDRHHDDLPVTVMTICNTGKLACAGYGTALGVVRALYELGKLDQVVALETRPYNQGSRLTSFEILQDELPGTLICDSMAASYMKTNSVAAVVVGADRVAANGDTANKIGTYALAVAAKEHHIPLYVAAPFTTLDLSLPNGEHIPIEERPPAELIQTSMAPENMTVWNPAFDVTPAKYIAGIVTEKGVIRPDPKTGKLNVKAFVAQHSDYDDTEEAPAYDVLHIPEDYMEQTIETLPTYIAEQVPKAMHVMGAKTAEDLDCIEVGDGNLNLVFIVSNKNANNTIKDETTIQKVIVKQALPYVRCVGTSWPLTLERAYFEYQALVAEKAACPEFVPDLYHFSKHDAIIVMQYIAPPNIILRKGLIQGIRYPTMASDMGKFCAQTLFKTSGLCLSATAIREKVQFWSKNTEMCALTEQVVFTEPYIQASNNRWTSPQLDEEKKSIENDVALKVAAAGWKEKFVTQTQALIHADLHTGSVMCSPAEHQTFVIDPEFAFYGPAGFDTGAFIANLFLSYVSQEGHRPGDDYDEWVLQQIQTFWSTFEEQFLLLWDDPQFHTGFLFGRDVFNENSSNETGHKTSYMKSLLTDTLGFAGMKMLRRIVGIAHVEDLESIEDPDVRAKCERRGLKIAKALIQNAASFASIQDVLEFARSTKS